MTPREPETLPEAPEPCKRCEGKGYIGNPHNPRGIFYGWSGPVQMYDRYGSCPNLDCTALRAAMEQSHE